MLSPKSLFAKRRRDVMHSEPRKNMIPNAGGVAATRRPVAEEAAPGRRDTDLVQDRSDGVTVPGAGQGRDVGGARVAQGVDGLRRLQAGPQRLHPRPGPAAAVWRRARQRQLLLPRVHAD